MRIPDLTKMQVATRVHEAMVSRIKGDDRRTTGIHESIVAGLPLNLRPVMAVLPLHEVNLEEQRDEYRTREYYDLDRGMPAIVRVDAFAERPLKGHVKTVATVASASDWMASDVKVYSTIVSHRRADARTEAGHERRGHDSREQHDRGRPGHAGAGDSGRRGKRPNSQDIRHDRERAGGTRNPDRPVERKDGRGPFGTAGWRPGGGQPKGNRRQCRQDPRGRAGGRVPRANTRARAARAPRRPKARRLAAAVASARAARRRNSDQISDQRSEIGSLTYVLCPLSSVRCPLSSVPDLCPLSSVLCPLSSVLCPLSSVLRLCPPSSTSKT